MMKLYKLLILFLFIPIFASSQIKDIQDDKINHFTLSFMASGFTTAMSNKWLSEHTDLKPFWCKIIAGSFAYGLTTGIGFIKEKNDKKFNPYDMQANQLGALSGIIVIEIIIFPSISQRQLDKKNLIRNQYEN